METILIISSTIILLANSPISISSWLLVSSVVVSVILMTDSSISLPGLVLILTFSSGVITIIIYVSSSTPNEIGNNSKLYMIILPILLSQNENEETITNNTTWYSTSPTIGVIALVLTLAILALVENSQNNTNALQTSY